MSEDSVQQLLASYPRRRLPLTPAHEKIYVEVFRRIEEFSLFLRGMVPWVGFKQYCIEYSQNDRLFGESKYSFLKMLLLALDEITSFSVRPLRLAKVLGLLLSMSSIRYALCALSVIFLQTMS